MNIEMTKENVLNFFKTFPADMELSEAENRRIFQCPLNYFITEVLKEHGVYVTYENIGYGNLDRSPSYWEIAFMRAVDTAGLWKNQTFGNLVKIIESLGNE